jgi:SPP1 gp7 family putative phage head morphogenesis protein
MTEQAVARGIFDRQLRHRIALERYASGEVRSILRFLQELEADTLEAVARLRIRGDLSRGSRAELRALEELLRELRLVYAEGYGRLTREAFGDFDALSRLEAEFVTGSLRAALVDLEAVSGAAAEALRSVGEAGVLRPTIPQLSAVVRSRPAQGKLLRSWFEEMEASHVSRIESALRIGFVEGETLPQLQRRMSAVWTLNRRGAEAVIRTAITHIAAEVAQESYAINPGLVQQVEWVSTLDSRTTPICRSRDGKRYPLDKGPRPPAHIRCRSTIIPIMDGITPPPRETYGQWLRRQSDDTQRDILGPTRYNLFSQGRLSIDRFTGRDGAPLTLDQLRDREPEAFTRAEQS